MKRQSQSRNKPMCCDCCDVTGDGTKVQCCKEQYCIGTWNARFMNQGKLKVVKQEMARVSVNILGISELKWTGMGEFNSDEHYIYYRGQESLRRNRVAIIVNKRIRKAVFVCSLKNNIMISVHFQANHSISQNNKIDYILCSQRWRSSILSAKTRPGADCGSDHELLLPNSDLN